MDGVDPHVLRRLAFSVERSYTCGVCKYQGIKEEVRNNYNPTRIYRWELVSTALSPRINVICTLTVYRFIVCTAKAKSCTVRMTMCPQGRKKASAVDTKRECF